MAERLRQAGDRVVAIGSADADLTSVRQNIELVTRLPDTVDALVLAAGRFSQRRIVTAEGFEQTFAIGILSRWLLAERLRPALNRAETPVILNLCGVGGIPAGRIHWDDMQLNRGYDLFTATMQAARANDLLGAEFTAQDPNSRIRYVLYNPLFVNSGMHRYVGQPLRTLVGVMAAVAGSSTGVAAERLLPLLTEPPAAGLTAFRRGTPVRTDGPGFDPLAAKRLYTRLAELTATVA
ncbi:hypothetical protein [Micromonospora sp. NBC_01813]|uniref:hypothetical protein n=1 Tax=Micromonospora sp. NBC_01813 TaxID=2975988 RepID=UPI002DDB43F0|nr:hypothetical protein [Micromonospora sp. NBC_01813]WSA09102.1 hypothetical protein OG958_34000 [Micromonospora sp. NBC_01813]